MAEREAERAIRESVVVDGGLDEVWDAWTTEDGIRSFFAPACSVELRVGGPYEMLFDLEAEPGSRGGEGVRILAIQPKTMLSFTWNAPPHMPGVRRQFTHVTLRLDPIGTRRTKATVNHGGWGTGQEWDQAYEYFTRAWRDVVLPRLAYRFSVGPVDWSNPPKTI
jgi:uncharacterized protein YndB with AHSA1/START domain